MQFCHRKNGTALKISHSPHQNLGILDMPKSQFLPYDPHNPPAYVAPVMLCSIIVVYHILPIHLHQD